MALSQEPDRRPALAAEPPNRDALRPDVSRNHRAWPNRVPVPCGGALPPRAPEIRRGLCAATKEFPRSAGAPLCRRASRDDLRDKTSRQRFRRFRRRTQTACRRASRTIRQSHRVGCRRPAGCSRRSRSDPILRQTAKAPKKQTGISDSCSTSGARAPRALAGMPYCSFGRCQNTPDISRISGRSRSPTMAATARNNGCSVK